MEQKKWGKILLIADCPSETMFPSNLLTLRQGYNVSPLIHRTFNS